MFDQTSDVCVMCGGDGRIGNAFGATKTCPGCGGSGRKAEDFGMRDVTKTKSAQGRQPPGAVKVDKPQVEAPKRNAPVTPDGIKLAKEVNESQQLSSDTKIRLVREIIDYEVSHGGCTRTFSKKVRKQLRPQA
jgi:hypothetical protein